MTMHVDVMDLVSRMRSSEECFCLATVVRTVSVTAAKAGAKAIIKPDGSIIAGWIGGGCARGAVLRASRESLADGQPRLVSVQPEDLLSELGIKPGESRDGVDFFKNACPSKGTMDIFIEPILPRPALTILGASPVALALAKLAPSFGYQVTLAAPMADFVEAPVADRVLDGFALEPKTGADSYVVVSTQGKGDEAALKAALGAGDGYIGFVGSRRKMAVLRDKLMGAGLEAPSLDRVKAPAGLDIGAISPEEIALSILAEITSLRRHKQRADI